MAFQVLQIFQDGYRQHQERPRHLFDDDFNRRVFRIDQERQRRETSLFCMFMNLTLPGNGFSPPPCSYCFCASPTKVKHSARQVTIDTQKPTKQISGACFRRKLSEPAQNSTASHVSPTTFFTVYNRARVLYIIQEEREREKAEKQGGGETWNSIDH